MSSEKKKTNKRKDPFERSKNNKRPKHKASDKDIKTRSQLNNYPDNIRSCLIKIKDTLSDLEGEPHPIPGKVIQDKLLEVKQLMKRYMNPKYNTLGSVVSQILKLSITTKDRSINAGLLPFLLIILTHSGVSDYSEVAASTIIHRLGKQCKENFFHASPTQSLQPLSALKLTTAIRPALNRLMASDVTANEIVLAIWGLGQMASARMLSNDWATSGYLEKVLKKTLDKNLPSQSIANIFIGLAKLSKSGRLPENYTNSETLEILINLFPEALHSDIDKEIKQPISNKIPYRYNQIISNFILSLGELAIADRLGNCHPPSIIFNRLFIFLLSNDLVNTDSRSISLTILGLGYLSKAGKFPNGCELESFILKSFTYFPYMQDSINITNLIDGLSKLTSHYTKEAFPVYSIELLLKDLLENIGNRENKKTVPESLSRIFFSLAVLVEADKFTKKIREPDIIEKLMAYFAKCIKENKNNYNDSSNNHSPEKTFDYLRYAIWFLKTMAQRNIIPIRSISFAHVDAILEAIAHYDLRINREVLPDFIFNFGSIYNMRSFKDVSAENSIDKFLKKLTYDSRDPALFVKLLSGFNMLSKGGLLKDGSIPAHLIDIRPLSLDKLGYPSICIMLNNLGMMANRHKLSSSPNIEVLSTLFDRLINAENLNVKLITMAIIGIAHLTLIYSSDAHTIGSVKTWNYLLKTLMELKPQGDMNGAILMMLLRLTAAGKLPNVSIQEEAKSIARTDNTLLSVPFPQPTALPLPPQTEYLPRENKGSTVSINSTESKLFAESKESTESIKAAESKVFVESNESTAGINSTESKGSTEKVKSTENKELTVNPPMASETTSMEENTDDDEIDIYNFSHSQAEAASQLAPSHPSAAPLIPSSELTAITPMPIEDKEKSSATQEEKPQVSIPEKNDYPHTRKEWEAFMMDIRKKSDDEYNCTELAKNMMEFSISGTANIGSYNKKSYRGKDELVIDYEKPLDTKKSKIKPRTLFTTMTTEISFCEEQNKLYHRLFYIFGNSLDYTEFNYEKLKGVADEEGGWATGIVSFSRCAFFDRIVPIRSAEQQFYSGKISLEGGHLAVFQVISKKHNQTLPEDQQLADDEDLFMIFEPQYIENGKKIGKIIYSKLDEAYAFVSANTKPGEDVFYGKIAYTIVDSPRRRKYMNKIGLEEELQNEEDVKLSTRAILPAKKGRLEKKKDSINAHVRIVPLPPNQRKSFKNSNLEKKSTPPIMDTPKIQPMTIAQTDKKAILQPSNTDRKNTTLPNQAVTAESGEAKPQLTLLPVRELKHHSTALPALPQPLSTLPSSKLVTFKLPPDRDAISCSFLLGVLLPLLKAPNQFAVTCKKLFENCPPVCNGQMMSMKNPQTISYVNSILLEKLFNPNSKNEWLMAMAKALTDYASRVKSEHFNTSPSVVGALSKLAGVSISVKIEQRNLTRDFVDISNTNSGKIVLIEHGKDRFSLVLKETLVNSLKEVYQNKTQATKGDLKVKKPQAAIPTAKILARSLTSTLKGPKALNPKSKDAHQTSSDFKSSSP